MPPIRRPINISAAPSAIGELARKAIRPRNLGAALCFPVFDALASLQRYVRQTAKPENACCCRREVDDPSAHKGSAIIDSHNDAPAIAFVGHTHARAERKRAMCRREAARLRTLAAGGTFAGIGIY